LTAEGKASDDPFRLQFFPVLFFAILKVAVTTQLSRSAASDVGSDSRMTQGFHRISEEWTVIESQ
jgi:hypothetical protein